MMISPLVNDFTTLALCKYVGHILCMTPQALWWLLKMNALQRPTPEKVVYIHTF